MMEAFVPMLELIFVGQSDKTFFSKNMNAAEIVAGTYLGLLHNYISVTARSF